MLTGNGKKPQEMDVGESKMEPRRRGKGWKKVLDKWEGERTGRGCEREREACTFSSLAF